MITLVSNNKLNFKFAFNQDSEESMDELRKRFIQEFGEDSYAKSALIIVAEEKFFHVIKNIYNLPSLYEFCDDLEGYLLQYLDI